MKIRVTREVAIPDEVRLARYLKAPELGPRILFFSGGSALRGLSRELVRYTHNSIHIITTFDSGGSSAKLREAFRMPAVGDIRARLMDLADQSFQGNPEIYSLFLYRMPTGASRTALGAELASMASGRHRLVSRVPDPMRKIIRHHIRLFLENMPEGFDLRGASIGNIVLTAGYIENRGHLDPVIYIYSRLAQVRGTVRPVLNMHLHLKATLERGGSLVGQHLMTGKEAEPIRSPIRKLELVSGLDRTTAATPFARAKTLDLIASAELICFPMGSFYSSLLANLLPQGIGGAIAANKSPKVYIPSLGRDPECMGMDLAAQVKTLLNHLRATSSGQTEVADLLNFVILDSRASSYHGRIRLPDLRSLGVEVVRADLTGRSGRPMADPKRLAPILLSLG